MRHSQARPLEPALVAMARGDGAREGLLHEVVGVDAGPATGEAL